MIFRFHSRPQPIMMHFFNNNKMTWPCDFVCLFVFFNVPGQTAQRIKVFAVHISLEPDFDPYNSP